MLKQKAPVLHHLAEPSVQDITGTESKRTLYVPRDVHVLSLGTAPTLQMQWVPHPGCSNLTTVPGITVVAQPHPSFLGHGLCVFSLQSAHSIWLRRAARRI